MFLCRSLHATLVFPAGQVEEQLAVCAAVPVTLSEPSGKCYLSMLGVFVFTWAVVNGNDVKQSIIKRSLIASSS